jgi:L-amino acid N-acyltransferase YncA
MWLVGIRIDPVSGADEARLWLELRNEVADEPLRADQRDRLREMAPDTVELLARVDDRVVAAAYVSSSIAEPRASYAGCAAYVLADARGRGVGRALYEEVSRRARALGKTELYAGAPETDEASLAFLRRRGFREVSRSQQASLDLADAAGEPTSAGANGIEVVTFAERPELASGAYAVAREAIPDVPVAEPLVVGSEEEWRRDELEHAILDLSMIALADGEVVGYSTVGEYGDRIGLNLMTGVSRRWRGRGIARALKLAQIDAARRAGLTRLVAYNDAANAPMQRLNVALGYRLHPVYVGMRGPLAPTA